MLDPLFMELPCSLKSPLLDLCFCHSEYFLHVFTMRQSDYNLSLKGLTLHLLVFTDKLNLSHQKLNLELDVILL